METASTLIPDLMFANSKNETLPLAEIVKKNITEITFAYSSALKKVKVDGILGWLGRTKVVQTELEATVTGNIRVFYSEPDQTFEMRFESKKEFESVGDYDETIIRKNYIMTILPDRYRFHIHAGNIKSIDWEDVK